MTRTTDMTTSAEQRASLAERAGANVFVAIHVNSYYPDQSVRGIEALYFSDQLLAEDVADGLALGLRDFEEPVRTTKDREQDNILSMPGVIVEAGYLSNAADRQLLQSEGFQNAVAEGIYQGILKYAPQISDIKAQLVQYRQARAKVVELPPVPAARPAPGWIGPAVIGASFGAVLLMARRRARRRSQRQVRYVVRMR